MRSVFVLISIFISGQAIADQCAWISTEQANRAKDVLGSVAEVVSFCELCDGDKPKRLRVQDVEVKIAGDKYKEVYINGTAYDLAYLFVASDSGRDRFDNLAKKVDCPVTGVSKSITYSDSGSIVAPDDWSGRYGTRRIMWILTKESGLIYTISVNFGSVENGNDRGSLTGSAELENDQLKLRAPFPNCSFLLTKKEQGISVRGEKSCGPLSDYLTGKFRKLNSF